MHKCAKCTKLNYSTTVGSYEHHTIAKITTPLTLLAACACINKMASFSNFSFTTSNSSSDATRNRYTLKIMKTTQVVVTDKSASGVPSKKKQKNGLRFKWPWVEYDNNQGLMFHSICKMVSRRIKN